MQDKDLMQDMLMLEKGVCDLYMHGAIEASTANVNQAFKAALSDSLTMQSNIYNRMEEKGWYQTEAVQPSQINSVKQKFSAPQA